MTTPRNQLKTALLALPDITISPFKDTDLICVFYKDREFAHFHNDDHLDIRLSKKIIREEKLVRRKNSPNHPKRSENSIWIELKFENEEDIRLITHVVQRACEETIS